MGNWNIVLQQFKLPWKSFPQKSLKSESCTFIRLIQAPYHNSRSNLITFLDFCQKGTLKLTMNTLFYSNGVFMELIPEIIVEFDQD